MHRPDIKHLEFDPPAALQEAVKCLWYDGRDLGTQPADFEVLPDGYAEIIFHFGSGCSIVSDDGGRHPLPSPFVMGLLNQPVIFSSVNRFEVIGIRCFPWTIFDLLGLPPGKDSVRIFEHPIASLQQPMSAYIKAGKVDEAIALVVQYFKETQLQMTASSILSKAGTAMSATHGTLPVNKVAAAAHATVRTLERTFKQSSGHTVKDVSALMRFEQVRNHLWTHPDANIAGLAAEMGYTDQSHLSREFKRFSGVTPAAFARKIRKATQAVNNDFVAFIQA